MKSELFVDVQPKEISIALLEDSRLVSLQKESRNIVYAVGDFYLAKVKKLMPGLNAAFVDVGYEKDAFLHYLDLGPQFNTYNAYLNEAFEHPETVPDIAGIESRPEIPKQGRITDLLQPGQKLLVQIAKEPISTKGPRLSTELTLTGRFMVLIPFGNKISISQKIKSTEEKIRLRQIISSIKPEGFGVIVRTSAEGKKVAELINELRTLVEAWKNSIAKMQRSTPPSLIYEEESRAVGIIRDIFNPSFESVYVNDAEVFEQIQNYVALIAPDRKETVKLYAKDIPIFDSFNITRQIKSAFGKTVSFKSGAYLIIEHTEALHVIDVNSGNRSKASQDQETNALEVNLRAADEIARQLRLRDMGGIIVVDFIDMAKSEHRQQLLDHMRDNMSKDRARHNILPLSKFGLMQITRQRVRPALDITTEETCPSCFGKGEIQPSLLFTDKLEEKLEYLTQQLEVKKFILYIHPFVDAYVKKGVFSIYGKWKRKFGRGFKIVPDESLAYLQYRVIDGTGMEIFLHEESDMNSAQSKNKTRSERLLEDETSAADNSKKETKKESKSESKKESKSETKEE
ncbi:MAG: Rne/Rng family ribonuclease [Muribaculaceae bacterium]|nr:Rne/Rng family ribonuclease [Muribaculaceae bacterium]